MPYHPEFGLLNGFYLDLWQALDQYFGDNRWSDIRTPLVLRPEPVRRDPAILKSEMEELEKDDRWGLLAENMRRLAYEDLKQVNDLLTDLKSSPNVDWIKRARPIKDRLRDTALNYSQKLFD